jgi:carbon monoxide dehydrogenase subunit G
VTQFSAAVRSAADISASRAAVWAALTDPGLLPKLTPLLRSISTDGDTWCWSMMRISALGVSVAPSFTEQMAFDEPDRITYTHQPARGSRERAGAEGSYELTEIAGGTHLTIELTLTVDLPLPKAAAPAVQRVMRSIMDRTGERFAQNLLRHLGAHELEPAA